MDEKFFEQASALELEARNAALLRSRKSMQGAGLPDCMDCGEPIPRERRLAMPSSIRCICCQTIFERK